MSGLRVFRRWGRRPTLQGVLFHTCDRTPSSFASDAQESLLLNLSASAKNLGKAFALLKSTADAGTLWLNQCQNPAVPAEEPVRFQSLC